MSESVRIQPASRPRLLVVLGTLPFVVLAVLLETSRLDVFDAPLLGWVGAHRSGAVVSVMRVASAIGHGVVLIPLCLAAGLLLWRRSRHAAAYVLVSGAGAGLANQFLKLCFARSRPDLAQRLAAADSFSFPSGHAMGSAAVFAAIGIVVAVLWPARARVAALLAGALIVCIGASRVVLGVHYPSDVLAGWGLGVAWALALRPLLNPLAQRLSVDRGTSAPASLETPPGHTAAESR